ncbi:hypothetical protein KIW84_013634, partial [Lathyrus oleraceus]
SITMKSLSIAFAVLVLLVVTSDSEAAISCSDVIKDLKPCVSYLVSGSGQPPSECCTGAKSLASSVSTSEDKTAACNCIKSTSKSFKINSQLAKSLPGNCGINIPISISPDADCSKIG